MSDYKEGYYKITSKDTKKIIIAYCLPYQNEMVFSFNSADGGGYIPTKYMKQHSNINLLEFTEVAEGTNRCSFCGKLEGQVALILKVNEKAIICNDCVAIAVTEVNKYLCSMHVENRELKNKESKRIITLN